MIFVEQKVVRYCQCSKLMSHQLNEIAKGKTVEANQI